MLKEINFTLHKENKKLNSRFFNHGCLILNDNKKVWQV
jgi:hypothetical protein